MFSGLMDQFVNDPTDRINVQYEGVRIVKDADSE